MKVIVGLGNPTAQYDGTRHNVGFAVIDRLSDKYNIDISNKKFKALYGKGIIEGEKVILAKPQTYMNLSGESVREITDYFNVESNDVIIICDDINLDVGRLRIREKGSAGGHNGLKNIIEHLGTMEFIRVRVGVGMKKPKQDLADFVLSRFTKEEIEEIGLGEDNAAEAVKLIIEENPGAAMNKFNVKGK